MEFKEIIELIEVLSIAIALVINSLKSKRES